jgi:hypothetical protein
MVDPINKLEDYIDWLTNADTQTIGIIRAQLRNNIQAVTIIDRKFSGLYLPLTHGYELLEDTLFRLYECTSSKLAQEILNDCSNLLFVETYLRLQQLPTIFDTIMYDNCRFPSMPIEYLSQSTGVHENFFIFPFTKDRYFFVIKNGDFKILTVVGTTPKVTRSDEKKPLDVTILNLFGKLKVIHDFDVQRQSIFEIVSLKNQWLLIDVYVDNDVDLQTQQFSYRYELLCNKYGRLMLNYTKQPYNGATYLLKHRSETCFQRCDYKQIYQEMCWYVLVGSAPNQKKNKLGVSWDEMVHYVAGNEGCLTIRGYILYKKAPPRLLIPKFQDNDDLSIKWEIKKPEHFKYYESHIYVKIHFRTKITIDGNFNNCQIVEFSNDHPGSIGTLEPCISKPKTSKRICNKDMRLMLNCTNKQDKGLSKAKTSKRVCNKDMRLMLNCTNKQDNGLSKAKTSKRN